MANFIDSTPGTDPKETKKSSIQTGATIMAVIIGILGLLIAYFKK